MATADPRLAVIQLSERIVTLDNKISASHSRIDKLEILISQDLAEIKDDFREMSKELRDVIAWMNRAKGWAAATLLVASLGGALFAKFLSAIFNR